MKRHTRCGDDTFAVATALLARRSTRWQNLGLWSDSCDYEAACEALAVLVGEAAGLDPRDRLLELACGSGAALKVWRERFGVTDLVGLELDPIRAARASQSGRVLCDPALDGDRLNVGGLGPFDAVVCVDAAYHLGPVAALARATRAVLAPGGRWAFTTLVVGGSPALPCPAALRERFARAMAEGVQIPEGALLTVPALESTLASAGFVEVAVRRLDEEVLSGFVRHVARRRQVLSARDRLSSGWLKIALTAMFADLGRRSGALGYALVSARSGLTSQRDRPR